MNLIITKGQKLCRNTSLKHLLSGIKLHKYFKAILDEKHLGKKKYYILKTPNSSIRMKQQ